MVLKGFKPCRCNQFCPECSVAKSKVENTGEFALIMQLQASNELVSLQSGTAIL